MELYPYNGIIYSSSQNYGYEERDNWTIVIDDGTFTINSFNITFEDTEIIPKDKIYVSKQSSFPSLLLSRIEGIDVSRTVSPDKATKIISNNFKTTERKKNCWYCEFISSNPDLIPIRAIFTNQQWCNPQYISSIRRYNHLDMSTYSTKICKQCVVIDIPIDVAATIVNYPDKFVLTEKLTDYTNKFLPKLDNDIIESFSSMLSGGDKESVKLGINLLSNYDLTSHIIPIAGMIRVNYQKLLEAKCTSLSSFDRVCNICGVSKDDLRCSTILDFNSKLYKSVNTDNDRILLRNIVVNYINGEVKAQYKKYISQMGLNVCID